MHRPFSYRALLRPLFLAADADLSHYQKVIDKVEQTVASNCLHSRLFAASALPRYIMSMDLVYLDVNEAYAQTCGRPRSWFLTGTRSVAETTRMVTMSDKAAEMLARAMRGDIVEACGFKIVRGSGVYMTDGFFWCIFTETSKNTRVASAFHRIDTRCDLLEEKPSEVAPCAFSPDSALPAGAATPIANGPSANGADAQRNGHTTALNGAGASSPVDPQRSPFPLLRLGSLQNGDANGGARQQQSPSSLHSNSGCLLYTSDAADE